MFRTFVSESLFVVRISRFKIEGRADTGGRSQRTQRKKGFRSKAPRINPARQGELTQFSTLTDSILLNSFSLFVINIKLLLNAWAAISMSSGPITFP